MTDWLFSLGLIAAGIFCTWLTIWSRRGLTPRSRWWVRRGPIWTENLRQTERLVILVLPACAFFFLAFGIFMTPGIPRSWYSFGPVFAAMVGAPLLFLLVGWRLVLPIRMYPHWLRDERRRDLEELRRR